MDIIKAKVIEILLDKYITEDEETGSLHTAILSGNMKKNKIYVGDNVNIKKSYDTYVITKLLKRKNFVIRPPVSNIDQMVLFISIDKPKPDYILLDKQIVLCKSKGITPVICINKIDLLDETLDGELKYIKDTYSALDIDIILLSAKEDINLEKLKRVLKDKTSAFSGNSGVGKSLTTSKLVDNNIFNIKIGELTEKINKGKHTTRYVKLYKTEDNSYILDTPGFSSYELYDIKPEELKYFYEDFKKYTCDYLDCNHINEGLNECKVKTALESKILDLGRYERYKYIYEELKNKEDRKYK